MLEAQRDAAAGRIVVGVDGSAANSAAIDWAAGQAARRHTGVLLVQVRPEGLGPAHQEQEHWHTMAPRLATMIIERFDVPAAGVFRRGEIVRSLADAAAGAQLLVLGRSDEKASAPCSTLPLACRCAQTVSCPVVSVPAGAANGADKGQTGTDRPTPGPAPSNQVQQRGPAQPSTGQRGPLVVALDSSPASWSALNWAVAEARLRGSSCLVVHAPDAERAVSPADGLRARSTALGLVDRAVEYAEYCGVPARGRLLTGSPTKAILDAAAGAALLVLGCPAEAGPDQTDLRSSQPARSSIAAECLRASTCPVVMVTAHHAGS